MDEHFDVSLKDIKDELWHRGSLKWLLYDYQLPVYEALREAMVSGKIKHVLNCSRRFGKTTILVLIAIEEALSGSHRHIRFASCTGKELRNAVHPIIHILLSSCPDELKPSWNGADGVYKFKNGSMIHLAGVNNKHEDDLRGANSHLNIVDEAGMVDRLKYLIQSILIPMTLTTDAITLIASTPSLTADHDYKIYYDEAMANNALSEFDIYANKSLSPAIIEKIKEDNGGENSTTWLREYMCRWVVDEDLDIIREWKDEYISEHDRDEYYCFYHKYTVMDLGVRDKTAILYAYYDFSQGKLIIEAEDLINGFDVTTKKINELVTDTEQRLWQNQKVHKRVADNNNPLLLQDLTQDFGTHFNATNKDSLEAMINKVRIFINNGRLVVHPDCLQLIGCLKYAIWRNTPGNGREFAKSAAYGHYDALASLVYLIRNLDQHINPIPPIHNMSHNTHHIGQAVTNKHSHNNVDALKKAFNR